MIKNIFTSPKKTKRDKTPPKTTKETENSNAKGSDQTQKIEKKSDLNGKNEFIFPFYSEFYIK